MRPSCPALCWASTSFWQLVKTWMAGTNPAMTAHSIRYLTAETSTCFREPYIATGSVIATSSTLAILRQFVERLGKPLHREVVRGLGALSRHALDHHVGSLAHGFDHPFFLGGILDPEAVALGVHRIGTTADLQGRFRARFQRVADHDGHFVADFLSRTRRDERIGRIARSIGRIGF